MGKCASKQQLHHRELLHQQKYNWNDKSNGRTVNGKNTRSSISEQSIFLLIENEGQTESKKRSRSVETRGTAMSFGFKKKLPSQKRSTLTADGAQLKDNSLNSTNNLKTDNACCIGNNDNNGNSVESIESLSDTGRSTPRLSPPKKEAAGAPYRSTRFGFRLNRPASTVPKNSSCENVVNNNHSEAKLNAKPRSKSACGSRRSIASSVTSNESHQRHPTVHFQLPPSPISSPRKQSESSQSKRSTDPKIDNDSMIATAVNSNNNNYENSRHNTQMQRKMFFMQSNPIQNTFNQNKPPSGKRSYTIINTELHTNEIHRPTPQAATTIVSKFTLHTSSLPQPQYPVPFRVPVSLAPRYSMDVKNAKQAANTTKKGFQASQREISADSGIGSLSSHSSGAIDVKKSPQRQRSRPRNLEMVFSGRNKFHVRDLAEDSLSDDSIQPLALPQLPTVYSSKTQPANLSGLVRATNNHGNRASINSIDSINKRIELSNRQMSFNSLGGETVEEEKLQRDNSVTEKGNNRMMVAPAYLSKSPSASNSITGMSIGEVMAIKDGFSISSSDSSKRNNNQMEYDDDISTITSTTDNKFNSISSTTMPQSQFDTPSAPNTNDVVKDRKFAALTASLNDILIDDETSPSDSLISSTASDDLSSKNNNNNNNKKKIAEAIKDADEKDINDVSPIFEVASPISHGTPTHATNSFSFSDGDGGRDFLIDDEIADQPVLCFGDNQASSTQLHSMIDTPTLKETSSAKSSIKRKPTSNNNSATNSYAPQAKPRQSVISRAESLDTLSPCESICSDDLMMDFECNSSIDSIDRVSRSNPSAVGDANSINGSTTKVNRLDEAQLWNEFEQNGGGHFRDWSYLLKTSRNKCQDISVSQLPARSTRLLNRSRLHHTNLNGTESPRSIENLNLIHKTVSQFGRDSANGSPDEQLFMLDKTLRNSMIQDVQYCKQQLLQLRSILQETASLNSFENNNGKFFDASGGYDGTLTNVDCKERDNYSPSLSDDPKHDLVDLKRQSQLDDKDRTIRIQQNLISKLEAEMDQVNNGKNDIQSEQMIDTVNTATQTDRVRPISMNFDGSNSNRIEDEDVSLLRVSTASSVSSSSSSLSSTSKSPKRNLSNTVIGKKILFENNFQKSTAEKTLASKSIQTTPTLGRVTNGEWPPTSVANDSTQRAESKYFRNIVGNTADKAKMLSQHNDLNVQINRTLPIKSVKLLNNLNALKLK
ncbi:putative uncharacterized protein DDB_G0277255 isoform X5 [Sitodiplosis mosellana]|uniref:putative uncharacterized protein DDB_G0277255 isoform X5 n=1 Tax=Sitodiplosis mosellana TaxID=263140 RepID=UPI0024443CEB|nr:putative uncharacterized protein DDB_G0277255 isoform X5 [Sitodiplosis mosellana]